MTITPLVSGVARKESQQKDPKFSNPRLDASLLYTFFLKHGGPLLFPSNAKPSFRNKQKNTQSNPSIRFVLHGNGLAIRLVRRDGSQCAPHVCIEDLETVDVAGIDPAEATRYSSVKVEEWT